MSEISSINLTDLKGIGEKTCSLLNKVGICNSEDLLFYYPKKYDLYMDPVGIALASANVMVSLKGKFISRPTLVRKGRFIMVSCVFADDTGMINVKWFNAPYIMSSIKIGVELILRGNITIYGRQKNIIQPKIYDIEKYNGLVNKLFPMYPLTKGLTNKVLGNAIKDLLIKLKGNIKEYLPLELVKRRNLCDYSYAISHIHFPETDDEFFKARTRLVYDELLIYSLALCKLNESLSNIKSNFDYKDDKIEDKIISNLSFSLTSSQCQAIEDILKDFYNKKVMNRLLQGDVGSGKTIVAFVAMIKNANSGYQSALMAPTETLAIQHYNNFLELLKTAKLEDTIHPVLLKSKLKVAERRKILEAILAGRANVIIGTHALFSNDVVYKNLALIVTDEQHRFGVRQRLSLEEKNIKTKPNSLIMSATPIPRTLALLLYADLDISILREKPANRLNILNSVTDVEHRKSVYQFVQKEIDKGHQAFFVCSAIEKDDEDEFCDLENVKDYSKNLKTVFGSSVNIGTIHGKMKPDEKDKIMQSFRNKEIDILVATTVIEVGIDVPNATVIVVEDANRFGLSTLHQLRGRVGRGNSQSYAIFVSKDSSENSAKRLSIILHSNDGFKIADADLKMRGPGEFFGEKQSGIQSFNIANTYKDYDVFKLAMDDAKSILNEDDKLTSSKYSFIGLKLDGFLKKRYTL